MTSKCTCTGRCGSQRYIRGNEANVPHSFFRLLLCPLQLCFQEENSELWFPELQDLPSSVTYMDMRTIGHHRLTALGCQNGYLKCALVDLTSRSESSWVCWLASSPVSTYTLKELAADLAALDK